MQNLKLIHCTTVRVADSIGDGRYFMAIDSLTPMTYVLCGDNLFGLDGIGNLKTKLNLITENVIAKDGSESIVGMEFLSDLQQICFCTSKGNHVMLDALTNQVDIVGCIPDSLTTTGWSPDFEILVAISTSNVVYMLNRDFKVTTEFDIYPSGFGTDDLITVGWGKKETQFHGSEGKQAALTKIVYDSTTLLDWDDKKTRVSWRGDGQFFCISAVEPAKGRTIRVWSREGVHCSTNERVDGLGQCLGWKPSGSLIASSRNSSESCQIIFYERNGLRHGEFTLPFDASSCQVQECIWNRDSTILALWLQSSTEHKIYLQFYTTTNYHWYCKQSYEFMLDEGPIAWTWDPDHSNVIHVAFKDGQVRNYVFSFAVNRELSIEKRALVAVIDGKDVLLTDFRKAIIPPPMCQQKVPVSSFVNEVVVFDGGMACLTSGGEISIFRTAEGKETGRNGIISTELRSSAKIVKNSSDFIYHLVHLRDGSFIYVLLSNSGSFSLVIASGANLESKKSIPLDRGVFQLLQLREHSSHLAVLEFVDGSFCYLTENYEISPHLCFTAPLASAASHVEAMTIGQKTYIVCLNERFQLTVDGVEISNEVNSFCLTDAFILFTTITHRLICLPYENFQTVNSFKQQNFADARSVERGSKIIAIVSDQGKVILQMPRGNLEAIYPRSLILSIVKRMLSSFRYKDALLLMRRHRVNLNLLFDFSPKALLENMDNFIAQINDSTLLNLFISDLKNEDVTETMYCQYFPRLAVPENRPNIKEKVNFVCGHLRDALRRTEPPHKFCTSILMTLVKMQPPQLDLALQLVKDFRDSGVHSKTIDDALQHLLYVIDANRLFDVALGTYDFDLVLMVAEKSQKDPKEFLPFLTELRSLESSYMKYKIDVHLSRFEKALAHLFTAVCNTSANFDEFMEFVKKHELFVHALRLVSPNTLQHKTVNDAFGDYLVTRRRYEEAAISYQIAEDMEKAVGAYTKSLNWRMALACGLRANWAENRMHDLCEDLSGKLKDQRLFEEASDLEYEQLKDIKRCVQSLLDGHHWEKAVLRINQNKELDLIDSVLLPAITGYSLKITEAIEKLLSTFVQYKTRLMVVRDSKRARLREINEKGDIEDSEIDQSSEASSTITRTSTAHSSKSASSRARHAKKHERKKYSLKEGNPYEDLGLLKELTEIVDQANKMQGDVASLLRVLAQFQLQIEGQRLQKTFDEFVGLISSSINEIWPETIDLGMLPGRIEDQLMDENMTSGDAANRFCGILDTRFKIKLDRYMIPPKINFDSSWALSLFS